MLPMDLGSGQFVPQEAHPESGCTLPQDASTLTSKTSRHLVTWIWSCTTKEGNALEMVTLS